jgi:hypothetical protein
MTANIVSVALKIQIKKNVAKPVCIQLEVTRNKMNGDQERNFIGEESQAPYKLCLAYFILFSASDFYDLSCWRSLPRLHCRSGLRIVSDTRNHRILE